ncbi:MAG: hypothetical protein Fur006_09840 [Coleofasciculaceae cyanobacterium]
MSIIKIDELYPIGSELFLDSESLLKELTDEELNLTGGFRASWWTRPRPFPNPFTRPYSLPRSVPIIRD